MLDMYVELMGGPKETAAIAYLSIEIQSAKIAIINAVARDKLEPRYFQLLTDIFSIAKTAQKTRDKIAHWTWGYSKQLPNAFLLANPAIMHLT